MTRKKLCTSLNMDATSTQVSYEALSIPKFLIHFSLFFFFLLHLLVYYEQTVDVDQNQYVIFNFSKICRAVLT